MPVKNITKEYVENGYYHIYNRGVEKRKIFLDEQDYGVFLSYLKEYLMEKDEIELRNKLLDSQTNSYEKDKITKLLRMNNFSREISLLAYCLMNNHFHFLIKQHSSNSIDSFMNSLSTRYVMYFNRKYKRVGGLFQSEYRAILVDKDEYLLQLSRYIHQQAIINPNKVQPSSYLQYLGKNKTDWINTKEILSFFTSHNKSSLTYENFVKEKDIEPIVKLLLEDDY